MAGLGLGIQIRIEPQKSGSGEELGFAWSVRRFGTLLGSGMEVSRVEAETQAALAAGRALLPRSDKAKHKQMLGYYLKTRPYLVAAVCDLLSVGASRDRIQLEALSAEADWRKQDPMPVKAPRKPSDAALALKVADTLKGAWDAPEEKLASRAQAFLAKTFSKGKVFNGE